MAKAIFKAIDWYVHIAMLVSIGLGIAAFFTEPPAEIHKSILYYVGEITGAAALLTFLVKLPEYIAAGATVKLQHGKTSIEAKGKKKTNRDEIHDENDNPEETEEP